MPAPEGWDVSRDGIHISDGDTGIYFRPDVGNQLLLGSEDPACDPHQWVDDPDLFERNVTIAQWDRNAREVVRVDLHEFNGRAVVGCRVWYRDGDEIKPGKTGLTLSVKHLPALADALGKALAHAIDLGLVEGGRA